MPKEQIPSPGGMNFLKRLIAKLKSGMGIVEDTDVATHTIAAGKYVTWKGTLCKAKAAIPSGTALSSSNLEVVSEGGFNELNSNFEWSNSGVKDISTGFQVPSWAKEAIVQGTKNTSQLFAVWEVVSVHMPIIGEANNSSASGYGSTILTVYINSSNQLSIVQSATSNIAYYRVFYR